MGTYTTTIPKDLTVHYKDLLKQEECVFSVPQYTYFQARNKNWQITFYQSGKVVVQGSKIDYIVQKLFLKETVDKAEKKGEIAPYPHIGIDESGKGDFFGPLVIAGCYLDEKNANILKRMGATDSKKLDDKKILELVEKIKEVSIYDVIVIGNKKYNELYNNFKNLNKLLAWGHATILENILNKKECNIAISDKFGSEKFVLSALKEKGKQIQLILQTKAESDTAVACASILARASFVKAVSKISYEYGINIPKGAGQNVIEQGKKLIQKYGIEELKNISKLHFKTYNDIQNHDGYRQTSLF